MLSVVCAIWRARALPERRAKRRTNSQSIGWGNFGAPPRPPSRSSNWADTAWNAPKRIASVRSVVEPRRRSLWASASRIWREDSSTSPRRPVHASAIAWSRRGNAGSPWRSVGGKYVPP